MNHSRHLIEDRRSPYPIRRKITGRKGIDGSRYEPAITLLPPDPYMMLTAPEIPRPVSPGVYRMLPPKTAKNKGSSFVILGENLSTPIQSRPASPSGRVSPFRGHGFKSPATSRPTSRAASPGGSPSKSAANVKKPKTGQKPLESILKDPNEPSKRIGHDIGLPPKSPKKIISGQLSEAKTKSPKRLAPNLGNKVARARQIYSTQINGSIDGKRKTGSGKNEANMVIIKNLANKKPPVPPKKIGLKPILKTSSALQATAKKSGKEKDTKKESATTNKETSSKTSADDVNNNSKDRTLETKAKGSGETDPEKKPTATDSESKPTVPEEKKEKEKLIPCFQPDKCHIAPPTMASPSPTISTTSTASNITPSPMKNSESIVSPITVTSSGLSALSSAMTLSGNLARRRAAATPKVEEQRPEQKVESVVVTMSTTEEVRVVQHVGSETSLKSLAQDPSSARSSTVTVRAASTTSLKSDNKADPPGETISTTKLITAGPDVEVLSPNNLLNSPPHRQHNMAWDEDRIPNGDVPSNSEAKGRLRRVIAAVWRLLCYLFCCGCSPCCNRSKCCSKLKCCEKINCKKSKCCRKSETRENRPQRESFWSKLNCFGRCKDRCKCSKCCKFSCNSKCCKTNTSSCKKIKCCEGSKCCKKKSNTSNASSKKCCAKMSCCSCKNCRDKVKNCCLDCGDRINSCCRSLFCLNLICCQRCLRKCRCCHKLKCCQKNGCCSCCNPNVKRELKKRNVARLDKKTSHASSQSKLEKEKLDPALVEHASLMKAAIPVLPTCLAVFCLIFNLFVPGLGTLVSGILCLCFGKPRFSVNDTPQNRIGSFCVNVVIAVAQLFTVIFCLVGWGWSIWWGVIMYKLSRKQKRLKLAEKNQQHEGGSSNVNQNHIDVEQG